MEKKSKSRLNQTTKNYIYLIETCGNEQLQLVMQYHVNKIMKSNNMQPLGYGSCEFETLPCIYDRSFLENS